MCNRYKYIIIGLGIFGIGALFPSIALWAQCSICTRTAQQLGPKAATGLNSGIIYLMSLPLILIGTMIWYVRKKIK